MILTNDFGVLNFQVHFNLEKKNSKVVKASSKSGKSVAMLGSQNINFKFAENLVYRAQKLLTTSNKRFRASFGSQNILGPI